jgi:hypothetical protein
MPANDPQVRALSCRVAAIERWHPGADTSDLRAALAEAQAAALARRAVDGLTAEQPRPRRRVPGRR